jgi:aspartate kinase
VIRVMKFGGTSVATVERIGHVADRAVAAHRAGSQIVVVVSAIAGETNRLLGLAEAVGPGSRSPLA